MTVGVIGIGYVGLPLAVAFNAAGHDVVAVDTDPGRFDALRGDVRESPALKVLTLLAALGADLRYHGPYAPAIGEGGLRSMPLDDAVHGADSR